MGESGYIAWYLVVYFAMCGSRASIQLARRMSLGVFTVEAEMELSDGADGLRPLLEMGR